VRLLPARLDDQSRRSSDVTQAMNAQRQAELAIFRYGLEARYHAECDRIDSQALGDVLRTALDEEMDLLDWGLSRTGGSVAKAELVARKVSLQVDINNRRIAQRFGR